jgi:hypothetical protein
VGNNRSSISAVRRQIISTGLPQRGPGTTAGGRASPAVRPRRTTHPYATIEQAGSRTARCSSMIPVSDRHQPAGVLDEPGPERRTSARPSWAGSRRRSSGIARVQRRRRGGTVGRAKAPARGLDEGSLGVERQRPGILADPADALELVVIAVGRRRRVPSGNSGRLVVPSPWLVLLVEAGATIGPAGQSLLDLADGVSSSLARFGALRERPFRCGRRRDGAGRRRRNRSPSIGRRSRRRTWRWPTSGAPRRRGGARSSQRDRTRPGHRDDRVRATGRRSARPRGGDGTTARAEPGVAEADSADLRQAAPGRRCRRAGRGGARGSGTRVGETGPRVALRTSRRCCAPSAVW